LERHLVVEIERELLWSSSQLKRAPGLAGDEPSLIDHIRELTFSLGMASDTLQVLLPLSDELRMTGFAGWP
jgi:hypothetical protein